MDTNTPNHIPYEFGDSTDTKTGPTYQKYTKNRRFSSVFVPKPRSASGFISENFKTLYLKN